MLAQVSVYNLRGAGRFGMKRICGEVFPPSFHRRALLPLVCMLAYMNGRVCGHMTGKWAYAAPPEALAGIAGIAGMAQKGPCAAGGLLCANSVRLGAAPENREEALRMLSELAVKGGGASCAARLYESLWERENLCPTGMGEGIAIPHARTAAVRRPCMAALTVPGGMAYPSLDGEPVRLLFMIATPEESGELYMELLARLSGLLLEPGFAGALMEAATTAEFLGLFCLAEGLCAPGPECLHQAVQAMA